MWRRRAILGGLAAVPAHFLVGKNAMQTVQPAMPRLEHLS